MRWLHQIEKIHNRAADTSFVWFPFVWLRPSALEEIDFQRRCLMAVLFGAYYGAFFALRGAVFNGVPFLDSILKDILGSVVIFFIWFNFVTAPLWNRRSKKLKLYRTGFISS